MTVTLSKPVLACLIIIAVLAVGLALYYSAIMRPGGAPLIPEELDELVKGKPQSITVSSPAFPNGGSIPAKYTCDGDDVSPEIRISGVPQNAQTLMLIMYDPDAPGGTFYHWALYNIPPDTTAIPEGLPKAPATKYGLQALNSFGGMGYGGPCPPWGHAPHRYVILILALDTMLSTPPEITIAQLIQAAKGHVIAYGIYMGTYSR